MIKDKIDTIVSNPKLSMSSSKISLDVMKEFSILTIDNIYAKNIPILHFCSELQLVT